MSTFGIASAAGETRCMQWAFDDVNHFTNGCVTNCARYLQQPIFSNDLFLASKIRAKLQLCHQLGSNKPFCHFGPQKIDGNNCEPAVVSGLLSLDTLNNI
jgi:hypothetical protein